MSIYPEQVDEYLKKKSDEEEKESMISSINSLSKEIQERINFLKKTSSYSDYIVDDLVSFKDIKKKDCAHLHYSEFVDYSNIGQEYFIDSHSDEIVWLFNDFVFRIQFPLPKEVLNKMLNNPNIDDKMVRSVMNNKVINSDTMYMYVRYHVDDKWFYIDTYVFTKHDAFFRPLFLFKCLKDDLFMIYFYTKCGFKTVEPAFFCHFNLSAKDDYMTKTFKYRLMSDEEFDVSSFTLINELIEINYYMHKLIEDRERVKVNGKHRTSSSNTTNTNTNKPAVSNKKLEVNLGDKLIIRTYDGDCVKTLKKRHKCGYEFNVIGHYRHYKSGKTIWVKPYTKGKGEKAGKNYSLKPVIKNGSTGND